MLPASTLPSAASWSRRIHIPRFATIVASGALLVIGVLLGLWSVRQDPDPPQRPAFVRAEGRHIVRDGAPFRLKAVGFANDYEVDLGEEGFSLAGSRHHAEADFARVRELGFNSIRFAFNGNWHRDDPRAFWRWLDQNLAWAKAKGILLILDLHVPSGGDWLAPGSGRGDFRIWTDPLIRAQTVELWRQIAQRYHDEPAIAAFDILNEAVTEDATGAQWRRLAADIAATIRAVDPNHLLIVGALYGTGGEYRAFDTGSQFLIEDANVMYDFHFYEPLEFTHQTADWLAQPISDGGVYPDPDRIVPTGRQVLLEDIRIESGRLRPGSTGWARYESDWVEIDDPRAVAGLPVATMRSGARGTVQFDDIEVSAYDPADGTVFQVLRAPLSDEEIWDWWDWGSDGAGTDPDTFARVQTDGANDDFSLRIAGDVGPDDYLGWSSDSHWFRVTPGHLYKVSGYMKGDGVAYVEAAAESARIGLALDIYADPPGETRGGFMSRGRDLLEARFLDLYAFGQAHEVPMSVMEFGTIRTTFEVEGKGGAQWVSDMLDIFDDHGASFAYWNYHGPSMGLYLGDDGSPPAEPNEALIEVFRSRLRPDGG